MITASTSAIREEIRASDDAAEGEGGTKWVAAKLRADYRKRARRWLVMIVSSDKHAQTNQWGVLHRGLRNFL